MWDFWLLKLIFWRECCCSFDWNTRLNSGNYNHLFRLLCDRWFIAIASVGFCVFAKFLIGLIRRENLVWKWLYLWRWFISLKFFLTNTKVWMISLSLSSYLRVIYFWTWHSFCHWVMLDWGTFMTRIDIEQDGSVQCHFR